MADEQKDSPADERRAVRLARYFDIRRIIGGLFLIYGVIITVTGIVGSNATKTKAAGINIDLWGGLALIVFALLMLAWSMLRPLSTDAARHE